MNKIVTAPSLADAMAAIKEANEKRGVTQRGGKKYTMVADRVEVFRRHFGADYAIVTTLVEHNCEVPINGSLAPTVIMRADIRDKDGIIATGHAAEVWGQGNVNKTSALENAETSAIGRALAALGLHGGEFASANELDAVDRKNGNGRVVNPETGRMVNPTSSSQLKKGGEGGRGLWPEFEAAMRAVTSFDELDAVEGRYAEWIATMEKNPNFKAAYDELRAKEVARLNNPTHDHAVGE